MIHTRSPAAAGTVIPGIPSVVSESLGLMFNMAPIKQVDFYASKAEGWWGASMQIQGTGGIGLLLGARCLALHKLIAWLPASTDGLNA